MFGIKFQVEGICGPRGWDCIEEKAHKNFSCSVTCEGIYADVQKEDPDEDNQKISKLVKQYNDFKKKNLPNFFFNPEKQTEQYRKCYTL